MYERRQAEKLRAMDPETLAEARKLGALGHARNGRFDEYCRFMFGWTPQEHQRAWFEALANPDSWDCLCIVVPPGHGKTDMLGKAWPSWMIGRDPLIQIGYVHGTVPQARKTGDSIRRLIDFRPGVGFEDEKKWTQDAWNVKGPVRKTSITPTYSCFGVGMDSIQGTRLHVIVCDDVSTPENTSTSGQRRKVKEYFDGLVFSRLTPRDHLDKEDPWHKPKMINIMTRWHAEDVYWVLRGHWGPRMRVIHQPALGWRELESAMNCEWKLRKLGESKMTPQALAVINGDRRDDLAPNRMPEGAKTSEKANVLGYCNMVLPAKGGNTVLQNGITISPKIDEKMTGHNEEELASHKEERYPVDLDKIGRLTDAQLRDISGQRIRMDLPRLEALWPERFPREYLLGLSRRTPEKFTCLYQGFTVRADGGLFRKSDVKRYDLELFKSGRMAYDYLVQFWDTAHGTKARNDWSACATLARMAGMYLLVDVYRAKLEFPDLVKAVTSLRTAWGAGIVVFEKKAAGIPAYQTMMREDPGLPFDEWDPRGKDKVARAQAVAPLLTSGALMLPREAPWMDDFEDEFFGFPKEAHDDQVDAVVGGVLYCIARDLEARRLSGGYDAVDVDYEVVDFEDTALRGL